MIRSGRIIAGFVVAPLVGAVTMTFVLVPFGEIPLPGFLIAAVVIACVSTFVLAIPAFLLTRAWQLRFPSHYAIAGLTIGAVPGVLIGALSESWLLAFGALTGGLTAGVVFGAIARRDLTRRWSVP